MVDADGTHVVAFVPVGVGRHGARDVARQRPGAVVLTRPPDERGCQAKGVFVEARDARRGRARVRGVAVGTLSRQASTMVGLPRVATDGWAGGRPVAVRFRVNALFDQTPGPGAGARIA